MYYTSESHGLSSNPCCFYSDEEDLSTLTSCKNRLVGLYRLSPVVLHALVVCISSGVAYPLSDSGIMHLYEWNVISNKNVELHNGLHHSDFSGWSFVLNMSGHIIVITDLVVPRILQTCLI